MAHSTKYLKICKQTVLSLVDNSKYAVFLFGSRASGNANKFSDIDIGILGREKYSLKKLFQIKNVIEEKDIPYKVDIVDFRNVDNRFKEIALQDIIVWNQPKDLKIS